jgi:AsmA protein
MEFMMRWAKIVIAGLLVVIVLFVVFGIPANFVAEEVKSRVAAQTGYRLRVDGETTIRLWPTPTIMLRDVTLSTSTESGGEDRLKAERIRAVLALRDFWHGQTRITELTVSHPTLRVALPRQRGTLSAAPVPAVTDRDSGTQAALIDRVVVEQGTIAFYDRTGRPEGQIEHVDLDASRTADKGATATAALALGSQLIKLDIHAQSLPQHLERQTIPLQVSLQAPGSLQQPVSLSAELRERNSVLAVNSLSGRSGDINFNGFATIDFGATKPVVKADLDFDRLQFLPPAADHGANQRQTALSEPWSDRPYDLDALNFFDAQVKLSTPDLAIASFHVAPVGLTVALNGGVVTANIVDAALYGGTATGTVVLDVSGASPTQAMNVRLTGVNALPLLIDVLNFDSLEGAMEAKINIHASGASQRAAISKLNGGVDVHLTHGAVRGIDLAKMMQNLTNTILNGWQYNVDDRTPLTDLSAHFDLANGVAKTDNLALVGPVVRMTGAGSIDISAKTLQLKVDPRLLIGQQNTTGSSGAGDRNQGTGLGVPVMIQGNWSEPRIYPDVAGILNDPMAVFDQLKSSGIGLFGNGQFGKSGSNGGFGTGGQKGGTFDNLVGGIGNILKDFGAGNGSGGSSR